MKKNGIPAHPNELIAEHYLRYSYMEYNQPNLPLMEALRTNSQEHTSALVANNGEVLMAAAMAGEGYILQPTFIVGEAIKQGKLQTILESFEPEPMGLFAVYPHRKLLARKLRAFIDFIGNYYGERPYWDNF